MREAVAGWGAGMPGVVSADGTHRERPWLLEARAVEREYGSEGTSTVALAGVSLHVEEGEFLGIMGPSGSGKSTLLNCLSGLDQPTSGSVLLRGRDLAGLSDGELARLRRKHTGFVFQGSNLIDSLTVYDNIAMALSLAGRRRGVDQRVHEVADELGVAPLLERHPRQLSRGQRQRVAAARAMAIRPHVLFADEPTGALDSSNARRLLQALTRLNHVRGTTVLMVTHDESAASFCQRVVFIRDGRVFAELVRGNVPRADFFSRIMGVVGMMGGQGDAR